MLAVDVMVLRRQHCHLPTEAKGKALCSGAQEACLQACPQSLCTSLAPTSGSLALPAGRLKAKWFPKKKRLHGGPKASAAHLSAGEHAGPRLGRRPELRAGSPRPPAVRLSLANWAPLRCRGQPGALLPRSGKKRRRRPRCSEGHRASPRLEERNYARRAAAGPGDAAWAPQASSWVYPETRTPGTPSRPGTLVPDARKPSRSSPCPRARGPPGRAGPSIPVPAAAACPPVPPAAHPGAGLRAAAADMEDPIASSSTCSTETGRGCAHGRMIPGRAGGSGRLRRAGERVGAGEAPAAARGSDRAPRRCCARRRPPHGPTGAACGRVET